MADVYDALFIKFRSHTIVGFCKVGLGKDKVKL